MDSLARLALRIATMAAMAAASTAFGASDIELWHSMDGAAGQELNRIADNFNASQDAYRVVPQFKGPSRETFEAGLSAHRAGRAPHILQIDDALSATATALPRALPP